ncbi:SDR family oxidoreductase, partial [Parafrankia sp. FMc6]|uniref:SDR family oxidoreductase n=1 Tax=Parafrankia soli TaxID=2599596 RepID=UPI0034D56244
GYKRQVLDSSDITADLSSAAGRRFAVRQASAMAVDGIDGVVTFAGLSGHSGKPSRDIVAVNYFGCVSLLDEFRPILGLGGIGAAVAIGSIGPVISPKVSNLLVEACLDGDEEAALDVADKVDASVAYVSSKLAVARWVRRKAPLDSWIGSGITLNSISPGFFDTPMSAYAIDTERGRRVVDDLRVPARRAGQPSEIAALVELLLGASGRYFVGSVLVIDGGLEAARRADEWPRPADEHETD